MEGYDEIPGLVIWLSWVPLATCVFGYALWGMWGFLIGAAVIAVMAVYVGWWGHRERGRQDIEYLRQWGKI